LRGALHEELLEIAATRYEPAKMTSLKGLSPNDLLLREPWLLRHYLHHSPDLLAAVHPVFQEFDPHTDESMQMASFKLKRDRIKLIEAQNFDDIIVEI
jgi:hypothetical protein